MKLHEVYTPQMPSSRGLKRFQQVATKDNPKYSFTPGTIVYDLINYLGTFPMLDRYENPQASYDDEFYSIPLRVLTMVTGLTKADLEWIDEYREQYEGGVVVDDQGNVSIYGGA